MQASDFAALLHVKRIGRGKWIARCPAHGDKRPSLSIGVGRKHPVVFKCMSAGCTQDEVLAAMGLTWKELLGDRPPMTREVSARVRDEQTLHTLRALTSTEARLAMLAMADHDPKRLVAVQYDINRRIVDLENRLYPELKAIRKRDAKTARFVKRWGWDRLWELYFERNPA